MDFKDMLRADLDDVFFNSDDFARDDVVHVPSGKTLTVVTNYLALNGYEGQAGAERCEIFVKKDDASFALLDNFVFDGKIWITEEISSQDEYVARILVRCNEVLA